MTDDENASSTGDPGGMLGDVLVGTLGLALAVGAMLCAALFIGSPDNPMARATAQAQDAAGRHYAEQIVAKCPPVAARAEEMMRGPISIDQIDVLDTLVDAVRSKPNGVRECPVRPLHPGRSDPGVMITGA